MAKKRIDYNSLKLEYFTSDHGDVKSFINHKKITYNAYITRKTKGRSKEKKERGKKMIEKAKQKAEDQVVELYKVPLIELNEMHKALVNATKLLINQSIKKKKKGGKEVIECTLSVSDLAGLTKLVKTEKGEPTTIRQTNNIEMGDDLSEDEMIDG